MSETGWEADISRHFKTQKIDTVIEPSDRSGAPIS
jgi:hypothetical protein